MIALEPRNLAEALELKGEHPDAVPLAGGTDLVAGWAAGVPRPARVLVLSRCAELAGFRHDGPAVFVGARVCHARLAAHDDIAALYPALAEAAASIGAPAVRNMGTLGGNLVTASPAADLPPALLVYEGVALAASAGRGEREIPLERFFPEYRATALEPDELLLGVRLPPVPASARAFFTKVGGRAAQACAKASLAVLAEVEGGRLKRVRVAAGSVAPTTVRLTKLERRLAGKALTPELPGQAGRWIADEIQPIDDIRSTAEYRRHVIQGVLERCLRQLVANA